jgi:hypothetical protein
MMYLRCFVGVALSVACAAPHPSAVFPPPQSVRIEAASAIPSRPVEQLVTGPDFATLVSQVPLSKDESSSFLHIDVDKVRDAAVTPAFLAQGFSALSLHFGRPYACVREHETEVSEVLSIGDGEGSSLTLLRIRGLATDSLEKCAAKASCSGADLAQCASWSGFGFLVFGDAHLVAALRSPEPGFTPPTDLAFNAEAIFEARRIFVMETTTVDNTRRTPKRTKTSTHHNAIEMYAHNGETAILYLAGSKDEETRADMSHAARTWLSNAKNCASVIDVSPMERTPGEVFVDGAGAFCNSETPHALKVRIEE